MLSVESGFVKDMNMAVSAAVVTNMPEQSSKVSSTLLLTETLSCHSSGNATVSMATSVAALEMDVV